MTKIAVCVIVIGEEYKKFYERYFKGSHERYCKKYGYDLLFIDKFLDLNKERHTKDYITFQKVLVPSDPRLESYEYVLMLDADIYIIANAPPLSEIINVCGDKIGAVNEAADPSPEIRQSINKIKGWQVTPTEYYNSILPQYKFETLAVINTGFLLIQPKKHIPFFKGIYDKYADAQKDNPWEMHFEQSVVGYEMQTQDLVYYCDNRWNCIMLVHAEHPSQYLMDPDYFFPVFLQKYSFLHFCAKQYLILAESLQHSGL